MSIDNIEIEHDQITDQVTDQVTEESEQQPLKEGDGRGDGPAPGHDRPAPSFVDLGVQPDIVAALDRVGITRPFPIQALTLPVAMTGHDIIGQAKTGTGKTLGFAIPTLQRVVGPGEDGYPDLPEPGRPQALVVVPTRELAVQVAGDVSTAATRRSVRVLTVYGGRAYEPQIEALRRGVEIVVGTPGRLLDLAQQRHLVLSHARVVVLDEADEMLDLGFLPDVERLLSQTPEGRQTMLFSATMPAAVVALARRYMTQPTHIRAHSPDDTGATVKATKQFAYRAHSLDKVELLSRVLQARDRGLTMIFARTKRTVSKVTDELTDRHFAVAAIHGDLGQGAREQALRAFRNGKVDVLVATDVAARGIDVDDVTHVVNYECPDDEKTYLHRIGRTARAGNTGTAITLVDWEDLQRWALIDRALDLGMPEPQETYSSSAHLYTDLDIPKGTAGLLPRGSRTRAGLDAEQVEDLGETGRRGREPGRRDGRGPQRGRRERATADREIRSDDDEGRRPRRGRQRRRTRGGRQVERTVQTDGGATELGAAPAAARPAEDAAPAATSGPAGSSSRAVTGRRRRRRGSRSGGAQANPD